MQKVSVRLSIVREYCKSICTDHSKQKYLDLTLMQHACTAWSLALVFARQNKAIAKNLYATYFTYP